MKNFIFKTQEVQEILPMKLPFVSFQYLDWLPRYKYSKYPQRSRQCESYEWGHDPLTCIFFSLHRVPYI